MQAFLSCAVTFKRSCADRRVKTHVVGATRAADPAEPQALNLQVGWLTHVLFTFDSVRALRAHSRDSFQASWVHRDDSSQAL